MIIHIPHASTFIPPEYRDAFDPEKLTRELAVMTDWYTDELFASDAPRVVFPVSRLVCDPERFRDDAEEVMSTIGMGAVYTNCSDGTLLRTVEEGERETILRRFYDPHHAALERLVEEERKEKGTALILDGHSFYHRPLPYEKDSARPDFCIGTDGFHTPRMMAEALIEYFQSLGFEVLENRPFSGSIVPLRYYRKDPHVHSIMIEVNRGLYLKNDTEYGARFHEIRSVLSRAIELLCRAGS